MFRKGVSNVSVPEKNHVLAREHSQARGLAFRHPGARGKADWWHAAIHRLNHKTASIVLDEPSEQPPSDRRRASTPGYGKQSLFISPQRRTNCKRKIFPRHYYQPETSASVSCALADASGW